jgi:hypothetical protein
MKTCRILILVLLTAAVYMVSAGVGAADEVNITFEGDFDGTTRAVAVSGNYAYIANGYDGILVVNINDKAAPMFVGSYDTVGYAHGVAVSGDYAYHPLPEFMIQPDQQRMLLSMAAMLISLIIIMVL